MTPVPTVRLALVAALLALVGLALPGFVEGLPGVWAGVALLDGALLLVAVADWALGVAPDRVDVERRHPEVVTLGQQVEWSWTLGNPTRRRLRVAVADELAPSLSAGTRRVRAAIPPGSPERPGAVEARTALAPRRRGRFEPTEVVVRVEGPLGLVARQGARRVPTTLKVLPPLRSRAEAELRIDRARVLEVGSRSAQGMGGGTEFDHLRDHGPDDDVRRIDWAATARLGRPIVRAYRVERSQQLVVLLDNGRVMAGMVSGVPRAEHALDAVGMLVAVGTRLGDRVGLVAFDRDVRAVVVPSAARSQFARVTEALYDLEPVLAESDYEGAFAHALARFRRRSLFVVLTELDGAAVGGTLLPALPLVARHHLVVVAGVADPQVAAWAGGGGGDDRGGPSPATVFRRAAAVAASDERRRTVARLRGLGAIVVDEVPGRLAPALADAYLGLKAAGRL